MKFCYRSGQTELHLFHLYTEKVSLELVSPTLSDHGPGHPQPWAMRVCEQLGPLYYVKRDYERSERYRRQAVDLFSRKFTVDYLEAMVVLYKRLLPSLEEVLVL
jgi:hypothetical protein